MLSLFSFQHSSLSEALTKGHYIALGVGLVGVIVAWWHRLSIQRSSRASFPYSIPPCATTSMAETIQVVSGPRLPFFLVEQSRLLQSDVFQLRLPTLYAPKVFAIGNPALVRTLLGDSSTRKNPKASLRHITNRVPSIFSSIGDDWHWRRKGLAPALSSHHVKRMVSVALEQADAWMKDITLRPTSDDNSSSSFDVGHEMVFLMLDSITVTGFEYQFTTEEKQLFVDELEVALREFLLKSSINPFRSSFLGYWLYPERRRAFLAAKRLEGLSKQILQAYRQNKNPTKGTIIDLIMNHPNYKSDEERAADVTVFLVAGHDTTGFSLAWAMRELAKDVVLQRQVRDDIHSCHQQQKGDDRKPNESELLRMVIQEAIRLYPVSAIGSIRRLGRDFIVRSAHCCTTNNGENSDGKQVPSSSQQEEEPMTLLPKGSMIFCSYILQLRSQRIFGMTADSFDPSRWKHPTDEMIQAFTPYGYGKQNCVGQSLAKVQLQCILSKILSEFELTIIEEGEPDYFLTLKPKGALLKATPIQ